jgi:hypothetical protein
MAITPLINWSQQTAIKKISANNQSKFAQIESETENTELRDLLGVALLQDLQENGATAANIDLIEGTDFVNCEGQTIKHKGVRFVLAYMIYSRYLGESFVNDTFSGFVQKNRTDSEQLSEGSIRRLQENNRVIAMSEWQLIKEFLDLNNTTYPLWNCTTSKKPYTPRFIGVRKTLTRGTNNIDINFIQL